MGLPTRGQTASRVGECCQPPGGRNAIRLVRVLAPEGADPEQEQHHEPEEEPAIDDVVHTRRNAHVAQVAEHHDAVGPHPVGEDGGSDGESDEQRPPPEGTVGQIRVERAERHRGNQITDPAAGFGHFPVSARDGDVTPFRVDRDAGELERPHRELRGVVHERLGERLSDRNREEKVRERERQRPGDAPAEHHPDRERGHRDERELAGRLHPHELRDQPRESSRGNQRQRTPCRTWNDTGEPGPAGPRHVEDDGRDDEAVGVGFEGVPRVGHRPPRVPEQPHQGGERPGKHREREGPALRNGGGRGGPRAGGSRGAGGGGRCRLPGGLEDLVHAGRRQRARRRLGGRFVHEGAEGLGGECAHGVCHRGGAETRSDETVTSLRLRASAVDPEKPRPSGPRRSP